jgi:transposase
MEYGAIDLHAKESQIRIVDAAGTVRLERRIATTRERLRDVFGARARLRILLETGTSSEWVAQHLESLGHEVIVADPNYALMYGQRTRRIKTDRRDVAALAEANRLGIYRLAHRTSAAQRERRRHLQVREHLVRLRVQAINVVRAQLRGVGVRVPSGASETFVARYAQLDVPPAVRAAMAPLLTLVAAVTPLLAQADRWTRQTAQADPVSRRLMTAPGTGPVIALTLQATLDDVTRFPTPGAATAYLGLVPREASSGERQRKGGITKAGPSRIRVVLIQGAWSVWRSRRCCPPLHDWVHRLAQRRGRRVAIVGLARRLARIMWAMWRDAHDFDPARLTPIPVEA